MMKSIFASTTAMKEKDFFNLDAEIFHFSLLCQSIDVNT